MKVVYRKNTVNLFYEKNNGKIGIKSLDSVFKLSDSETLLQLMLLYLNGKQPKSINSWSSRIISTLSPLIDTTDMTSLPQTSKDWSIFIKNWYGFLLTYKAKGSIETRVSTWNKNIKPFLEFMQQRDVIPLNTIIPRMKNVGQHVNNSSFSSNIIGDTKPKIVTEEEQISRLIMPISLSRTDSQYLDEIRFDLETKRNKLYEALAAYWNTIKEHYEFGKNLIESIDISEIHQRINDEKLYHYTVPFPGKKIPPRRRHFAKPNTTEGLAIYLYIVKNMHGMYCSSAIKENKYLPKDTISSIFKKYKFYPFPNAGIENIDLIPISDRVNWCLGIFQTRDISYIMALLIMLNPKFTTESLLFSKTFDHNGKIQLKTNEIGESFEIDKQRAKSKKVEQLDELSYEIIDTLINLSQNKDLISNKLKSSLFISVNKHSDGYVIPAEARIYSWITGYNSKEKYIQLNLSDFFPSLHEADLIAGSLSHSKIRNTEGVLEWFRTGSIKCVSRKLGNSNRVALEYYLPKELIAIWSTRQVRRFQNLLIVTAMSGEDNLLKSVDFNSISEVHDFIIDMININDKNGNNPLINYLKENNNISHKKSSEDLISSISKESLTILYTYKIAAERSNIKAKNLSEIDKTTNISPLSIIKLSTLLSTTLNEHSDTYLRNCHIEAINRSKEYSNKVNWHDLFIKRTAL